MGDPTVLREKWKLVRDALVADLAEGRLRPGDRLPTEPDLGKLCAAGRHSVRRAVATTGTASCRTIPITRRTGATFGTEITPRARARRISQPVRTPA